MDEQNPLARALLSGLPDAEHLIEIMARHQAEFLRENAADAVLPDQRPASGEL